MKGGLININKSRMEGLILNAPTLFVKRGPVHPSALHRRPLLQAVIQSAAMDPA
jgi:hypothetical protein